jgi:hypothetical protein
MPNQKRDRSHNRLSAAENANVEGFRDHVRETEATIREGVERAGQQMREGYQAVGERVASGYRQAEGLVASHPTQSLLIGFGLGFGLGVLLTVAVTHREEQPWWRDWRIPDSLRHLPERFAH